MPKASAQTTSDQAPAGDLTRRRLLEAAAVLIVERGWVAATTRAVADRAGVNQALVHYHFGAIGNLRREAVMARIGPQIEGVAAELLDDRPIPVSIHRVMQVIDGFDLSTEAGVLMAEALLQATRDPQMAEAMRGVMGSWNEVLGPRMALAQERGVVRDDIPVERLTSVLASLLDGFLIQRMADPGLDAAQTADTIVRLLEPPRKEAS